MQMFCLAEAVSDWQASLVAVAFHMLYFMTGIADGLGLPLMLQLIPKL